MEKLTKDEIGKIIEVLEKELEYAVQEFDSDYGVDWEDAERNDDNADAYDNIEDMNQCVSKLYKMRREES